MYNRGELIVQEDDVRGVLGHLRTTDAHSHADVRLLQRWRVVNAIAGHGDDVTVRLAIGILASPLLQRLHNELLVDRRHTRKDPCMDHHLCPEGLQPLRLLGAIVRERLPGGHFISQLLVGDDGVRRELLIRWDDGDLLRNRHACIRVVAGNHDDLDPCRLAILNGLLDAGLGRILDPEKPNEDHVGEEIFLCVLHGCLVPHIIVWHICPLLCNAQHPPCIVHQLFGRSTHRVQHLWRHRSDASLLSLPDVSELAELEHPLRSALQREDLATIGVRLGNKHPLVCGIERDLVQRHVVHYILDLALAPGRDPRLGQCNLCGRPHVLARASYHSCVIAHAAAQHL
mmetsp:Transcript_66215/g.171796  ORF Transcript_66215/g.171796 Transcript_66215/m.171796 type:complete len:343 (-) Transcript_66215:1596-2624(-)